MAKKKATKKAAAKTKMKPAATCTPKESCNCGGILALIIIVLTWWKPSEMWANITITVLAALILLSANSCYCKK